jgi:hypothetical protein
LNRLLSSPFPPNTKVFSPSQLAAKLLGGLVSVSDEVRAFLSAAGKKGGSSKSPRKQAASRRNGKKGQPELSDFKK